MVALRRQPALYSFKPDDSRSRCRTSPPGRPRSPSDNKTITVHIKPGVKYAPPVNRAVKTAGHQVRLRARVLQGGPQRLRRHLLQLDRRHAREGQHRRHQADLGHRDARRPHDRVQAEGRRGAAGLAGARACRSRCRCPRSTRRSSTRRTPSTYDQHVAFTGPYMVKNDPTTGKVTGRVPGKSIDIVRNPNWDKSTDYRPAYLDAIQIQEGNDDLATSPRAAPSTGRDLICCDAGPPPAQVLKQARATQEGPGARSCRPAARATSRSTRRSSRSTTSTSARRSSPPSTATPCA